MKAFTRLSGKGVLSIAAVIAIIILILGAVLTTRVEAQQAGGGNSIVGTWRVQVTTFNCSTGQKAPTFVSMLSFAPGGVLMETTASPAFAPGQRSSGHGIWSYSGGQAYNAVSEAYILFATTPHPPVPGFARGVQRISQTIHLNGDQLTADATILFFDMSGKQVMKGCATAAATRMK